jgi:hypothetical protein
MINSILACLFTSKSLSRGHKRGTYRDLLHANHTQKIDVISEWIPEENLQPGALHPALKKVGEA